MKGIMIGSVNMVLSRNGKNNPNGSFDWGDALADAAIMAGLTFFTTLGGLAVTDLLKNPAAWLSAGIAAGAQFCAILALKRGLREK